MREREWMKEDIEREREREREDREGGRGNRQGVREVWDGEK